MSFYSGLVKAIPMERLCRDNPQFNIQLAADIRQMSLVSKGKAIVMMHPRFSLPKLIDYNDASNLPYITKAFDPDEYSKYLSGLKDLFYRTKCPTFIFSNDLKGTHIWLTEKSVNRPFVVVPTVSRSNPVPNLRLEDNESDAWAYFSVTLIALGIRRVDIAGELSFKLNGEDGGCVSGARLGLKMFFDPVRVLHKHTFPNTRVRVKLPTRD